MKRIPILLMLLVALAVTKPAATPSSLVSKAEASANIAETSEYKAPLFKNLGNHNHPISTQIPLAQRYFNQGLILTYAFNHAEAERSFREAARLDPNCAMCYWGAALVLGPNINAPMDDEAASKAYTAIQKAIALSKNASNKEKAYIQALAQRYSQKPVADRKPLNMAYAKAMQEVHKRYPDDLDAATLFAEALMDTTPWDYWTKDGQPKPETTEILAVLESVLQQNPNHPGANHLYIHAVEASPHPERGMASADRLRNMVPGAGHLVHMPAHIYIRTGRYHDTVVANQQAIAADQDYITQCHAQGLYPVGYMPHNHHFLLAGAAMGGESKLAIQAARHTSEMADKKLMREPGYGTLQHYYAMPLYALTKFGKWDEILKQPAPAKDLKYPNGVWHYARGMAFKNLGQMPEAKQELEKLRAIASDSSLEKVTIWDLNTTASLMQIALNVLSGELAAKQGNYMQATHYLRQAVELEDKLNYDEPATWYSPVRQSLGAVLLKAKRLAEAEAVYRKDLKRYPENGWSLFGLVQSLRQQGKTKAAKEIQARFDKAWKYADVTLTASRF